MISSLIAELLRSAAETRTCTFTIPSLATRSQQLWNCWGHHHLRYDRFLCPFRSHIIAVPLPLVYKSSPMVPSNVHHHSQFCILGEQIPQSTSCCLSCHPTYTHPFVIISRDAFQVLHRFIIPPRFDILCQCQRYHHSLPRRPRHPRSQRRSAPF